MHALFTGAVPVTLIIFWLMAVLPACLPMFLLFVYFRRFTERKRMISRLLDRSVRFGRRVESKRIVEMHREEWKSRLNLDLLSYIYPMLIASCLVFAGTVVLISKADPGNRLQLPQDLIYFLGKTSDVAIAGFAGAYVWGMSDIVNRFRILNMPVSAVHSLWFRLLLGPILGSFAQVMLADRVSALFIFTLMFVPVSSITQYIGSIASQQTRLCETPSANAMWELVQGITPDIVSRLTEANVSSVAQLANQDPVNLLRRTNLEWRIVLDMIDQAYLVTYVGDKIAKLRCMGIRGAIEMSYLSERSGARRCGGDYGTVDLLNKIAAELGISPECVRNLAQNLAVDPKLDLLWSMWSDPKMDSLDLKDVKHDDAAEVQPEAVRIRPFLKADTQTA